MTIVYETLQNGTERLSERFHTVEIENQNLLKTYDKLSDRRFFLPRWQSTRHPNNI